MGSRRVLKPHDTKENVDNKYLERNLLIQCHNTGINQMIKCRETLFDNRRCALKPTNKRINFKTPTWNVKQLIKLR
jgi:hypothetical protein